MKKYQLVYAPVVFNDLKEAVTYYNKQSPGFGNRFLTDFNLTCKSIELNPFFASIKYKQVRCAAFKRFPFSVHYAVNKKLATVVIIAVFNTWKKPLW